MDCMYKAYKNNQNDTYVFFNDQVEVGKLFTFRGEKIESQHIHEFEKSNLYEVNFTNALKDVVNRAMTAYDFHSTFKLIV